MHSIVVSVRYDSLMQFIRKGLIQHLTSQARELNEYKNLVPLSSRI